MLNKILRDLGLKHSIEEEFFNKYFDEQRRLALRSVYTASSRPVKPGIRGY
jgi:hypothetical protein